MKECKRSLSVTNEEVKREISRVLRRQTKVIYFLMTLNTSASKKHENGMGYNVKMFMKVNENFLLCEN